MATPFRTRPEPLPQTRVNAASQLADRLRAAIMDNSLPPDTRLSEVETAQQYGVSRQPVREAFIALAGQGLLGQGAYTESVRQIEVLRAKANKIVADSGFEEHSHGAEAIWSVLDTFPRDELFQATAEELEPIVAGAGVSPRWSTSRATATTPRCASG